MEILLTGKRFKEKLIFVWMDIKTISYLLHSTGELASCLSLFISYYKNKNPIQGELFHMAFGKGGNLDTWNLNKRKHNLCTRCYLCKEQVETVNHLFLHCKWTDQLCRCSFTRRRSSGQNPGESQKFWNDGIWWKCRKKDERWRIVPACIWWTIWN